MSKVITPSPQRLLHEAAKLFVLNGYHNTSTRAICKAAEINISAISYYYEDKAGLYRSIIDTVFNQLPEQQSDWAHLSVLPRRAVLEHIYNMVPLPQSSNEFHNNAYRILMQERFQPSGVLDDYVLQRIIPRFNIITYFICRELNLIQPDLEANFLAIAIIGVRLFISQSSDLVDKFMPRIFANNRNSERLIQRLIDYAEILIDNEIASRQNKPSNINY